MSIKYLYKAGEYLHAKETDDDLIKFLNWDNGNFNPVKTSWCAKFVGAVIHACGGIDTKSNLARSYLKWGKPVEWRDVRSGDIVILKRGVLPWQGHVGIFNAWTLKGDPILLGGNQDDTVKYKAYPLKKVLGYRREI